MGTTLPMHCHPRTDKKCKQAGCAAIDKDVPNAFKAEATMGQTGFGAHSICEIFRYLKQTYGKLMYGHLKAIKATMAKEQVGSTPIEPSLHQIEVGQKCLKAAPRNKTYNLDQLISCLQRLSSSSLIKQMYPKFQHLVTQEYEKMLSNPTKTL